MGPPPAAAKAAPVPEAAEKAEFVPAPIMSPPSVDAMGGGGFGGGGFGTLDVVASAPDVQASPVLVYPKETLLDALKTVQTVQEQRKVAKRTSKRAKVIDSNVKELGQDIRKHRFARLNRYALRYDWNPDHPPARALRSDRVMGWWEEWVELQGALGVRDPGKKPQARIRIQSGIFEEAAK